MRTLSPTCAESRPNQLRSTRPHILNGAVPDSFRIPRLVVALVLSFIHTRGLASQPDDVGAPCATALQVRDAPALHMAARARAGAPVSALAMGS